MIYRTVETHFVARERLWEKKIHTKSESSDVGTTWSPPKTVMRWGMRDLLPKLRTIDDVHVVVQRGVKADGL